MPSRRVILAGGSGFLGRALAPVLVARGYEAIVLTRDPTADLSPARAVAWDGKTVGDWAGLLDGAHAVVNLAGKNVNCRYTPAALREIDESRVNAVAAIGRAIAGCRAPPRALVQSGTLAILGDAGDAWRDEDAPLGEGVPPATAKKWEAAFHAHPTPGTRRVLLRISFALGRSGGALKTLAGLTRCFLGGAAGSGRQYISWVHLDDLSEMFLWAIERESIEGLYNATAPNPVTNAEFMRELRRVLRRPWAPPTPAWAVRVGAAVMRTEPVLALTGRRGTPRRFVEAGFEFKFPTLPEALRDLLG